MFDPSGELRYIGKCQTSLYRRLQSHKAPSQLKRFTHRSNWIKSLLADDQQPTIDLIQELNSADELMKAERYWIEHFKNAGCRLTNTTKGGDGSYGYRHSEETKAKIAGKLRGNRNAVGTEHSKEYRDKISKVVSGAKRSPEVVAAMRQRALDGNYISFIRGWQTKWTR